MPKLSLMYKPAEPKKNAAKTSLETTRLNLQLEIFFNQFFGFLIFLYVIIYFFVVSCILFLLLIELVNK